MAQKSSGQDLFAPESPLMSGLGRLTMILVTAFLWTLTSLPVITVGASSSAVFYVMLKAQRGEEGNYIKDYFRAFRENFKQSTVCWLLLLALGLVFGFSAFYYDHLDQWTTFLFGALIALTAVVLIYVFPIISRFSNSLRNILMMALLLPFKNLGWTLALAAMAAAVVLICIYFTPLLFFGYGLFAYCASFIFPKIFKPLEEVIEEKNNP